MVKVAAVIQARLSSTRLPAKVMKDLNGKTLIERVVNQVRLSEVVDEIWIATSTRPEDDILELMGNKLGVNVFRGSLGNVLKRYYDTMQISNADIIVRVTADNPFMEPTFIDCGVEYLKTNNLDYVSFDQIPYGSGVEIIKNVALGKAYSSSIEEYDREHVTPYIRNNKDIFKLGTIIPDKPELRRPDISVTIDTMDDYVKLYKLINCLEDRGHRLSLTNVIEICNRG
ncbi:cytidylyltransferase domain-containing protein [Paenibacillus sp. GM2]|uniref:cytidylyltransferase domain-containing protein n=1 Tax=Paenibacillus sp. GM2 TaxID=1622070 RepID=UPI000837B4D9|nr:glycosyltransferase family protein [Paenibacillus sp. GM2]